MQFLFIILRFASRLLTGDWHDKPTRRLGRQSTTFANKTNDTHTPEKEASPA